MRKFVKSICTITAVIICCIIGYDYVMDTYDRLSGTVMNGYIVAAPVSGTFISEEPSNVFSYSMEESDIKKLQKIMADERFTSPGEHFKAEDVVYKVLLYQQDGTSAGALKINRNYDLYIGNNIAMRNEAFRNWTISIVKKQK